MSIDNIFEFSTVFLVALIVLLWDRISTIKSKQQTIIGKGSNIYVNNYSIKLVDFIE